MNEPKPEVFISEQEISERVKQLGKAITSDYQGEELVVICILKGAFVFCADLIKNIELPIHLNYMAISSYHGATESSGEVQILMDLETSLAEKDVLIVEDIVDSGLSMKTLLPILEARNPKSIKLASLLSKPSRNIFPVNIDYLAFEIPDKFVIGYGLDYAQRYRELPYIGVLNAGN